MQETRRAAGWAALRVLWAALAILGGALPGSPVLAAEREDDGLTEAVLDEIENTPLLRQIPASLKRIEAQKKAGGAAAVRHPVLPTDLEDAVAQKALWARRADGLLNECTEEEWLRLVPRQSPRGPSVTSPVKGFEKSNAWKWDPHKPDQIICAASGVTFPNPDYPVKYKRVKVLSGKTVDVPYYETHGGKGKTLVRARIDCEKTLYMTRALGMLARAYAATRDERYARRVAIALDAWADYYPDYFITLGQNGTEPINPEEGARTNFRVERASHYNGFGHEMTAAFVSIFDDIYDSEALQALSKERKRDVRAHIANDLYMNFVDYFRNYVPLPTLASTNLPGSVVSAACVGVMLNRLDVIQWVDSYKARRPITRWW